MKNHLILLTSLFILFISSSLNSFSADTGSAKTYLDEGIQLYQQEKYFEAIDSFRNAIGINPYYGDAYKYMAEVFFSMNDYNVALENGQTALKYANNDLETKLLVANTYRELGNSSQAENFYQKITADSPSYAEAYRNMAELYLKMNRLSMALTMINKADRLKRNFWNNYITFGNYYLKNNNFSKAEENYKKAFNLNPTERSVYVYLADFYRSTGNYNAAVQLLENGEKLFDNFYSGIVILADCYLRIGLSTGQDFQKAFDKFQWINQANVKKDSLFKSGLFYKMALASEKINKDQAVQYYKQSLSADPSNEFVRYSFESFAAQNFKVDDPIRKSLSVMHYTNALDSYKNGDMFSFFFSLKRSINLYPFQPEARQKLINYYEQNGNFYAAYQELKSIQKVDSSFSIQDKIENYDWQIQNKKLSLIKPDLLPFRGLFLVNADYYNFSSVYSDLVLYGMQFSDKFKFLPLPFRNKQGVNYILEYLREKDYSFFVIASLDNNENVLKFSLYDKTGKLLDSLDVIYNQAQLTRSFTRFYDWMHANFPEVWKIGQETAPGVYRITGGKKNGLSANTPLTALNVNDYDAVPVALMKQNLSSDYYSDISVSSNFVKGMNDSLTGRYVIPSSFLTQKSLTKLKRILGY